MDTADLAHAQEAVNGLLVGLGSGDWARSTPCSDWDVAAVMRHLVVGERAFAISLTGTPYDLPAVSADVDQVADAGLAVVYADGAVRLREALLAADPTGTYPTGLGPMPPRAVAELRTIEALAHGWDVARGAGRQLQADDEVVERAHNLSRSLLGRLPADRTPFDPPQPVDDAAPALDRLAALLGRSVDP